MTGTLATSSRSVSPDFLAKTFRGSTCVNSLKSPAAMMYALESFLRILAIKLYDQLLVFSSFPYVLGYEITGENIRQ